jgi:hypothetical protein
VYADEKPTAYLEHQASVRRTTDYIPRQIAYGFGLAAARTWTMFAKWLGVIDTRCQRCRNGFCHKIFASSHWFSQRFALRVPQCGDAKAKEGKFGKFESSRNEACPSRREIKCGDKTGIFLLSVSRCAQ